jgi:hypothetical protein
MTTMTLKPDTWPQPMLNTILRAVEPFSGARAAAEKAIADAANAPTKSADVHVDETENWKKQGWQLADQSGS